MSLLCGSAHKKSAALSGAFSQAGAANGGAALLLTGEKPVQT